MATTENTYTGDGSTVLYSFTFPYINETDVYVTLDGTVTTAYTYANATTIQLATAPASGVAIRIYRETSTVDLKSAFFAGSAIRARDLNDNFTQSLYISQESENVSSTAQTTALAAQASAATAITTANTANTNATAANTAATASAASAASALTASQSAQASATAAATSAASAASEASQATASVDAIAASVAAAGFYEPLAALANLPTSPSNQDRVEIINSTGVESSSSISGVPSGFIGSSELTVRLQYNSSTSKWEWQQYFATDPDNRYGKFLETPQSISSSKVIASNTNAGLMGPTVAVASGVTITVGSNSRLSLIS